MDDRGLSRRRPLQLTQDILVYLVQLAPFPLDFICLLGKGNDDVEAHVRAFEVAVRLLAEK